MFVFISRDGMTKLQRMLKTGPTSVPRLTVLQRNDKLAVSQTSPTNNV